ncbi:MAG: Protein UmuC [Chlamydiia bacterium]|nr:Protein UmuC [Chlamydiia bacterium]
MLALVDCNNFYASCEAVFNPSLIGKPLVVLSSNDGCVVARSKEARALGIPMGAPAFTFKDLAETQGVISLSSNFPLYADMSERVMLTLESLDYEIEIYSIDEAFIQLPDLSYDKLEEIGKRITQTVKKHTGIQVSVGIAPTKTLAKLANRCSKKMRKCTVILEKNIDEYLKDFPIQDLWGIGKGSTESLKKLGIYDALSFKNHEETVIKKKLSISGLKHQLELKGVPCISTKVDAEDTKSILSSRTFHFEITDFNEIRSALASFCHTASKKLRRKKLFCGFISIFLKTNRFKEHYKSHTAQIKLPAQTNSTRTLLNYAEIALHKIYKKDLSYKRAGILLTDFTNENFVQKDLLAKEQTDKEFALMKVIDSIHNKYGNRTLLFGSEQKENNWIKVPKTKSSEYTTSWDGLPIVKAD